MAGSFSFDPYSAQLAGNAVPVGVFRYDPTLPADTRYAILPNVFCESVQYREGPQPPIARFSYLLDDSASSARLPYAVRAALAAGRRRPLRGAKR